MKTPTLPSMLAVCSIILLAGCSTEYQAVESRGPVVRQGEYGTRQVVDGVDIWTYGEPPRKYQVIGIVRDSRGGGIIPMAQYYHDVAKKVRASGGDAAIEVASETQLTGIIHNSWTNSSGNVSAIRTGNLVTGRYSGTSNTTGFSTPIRRHYGTFVVVKYL